MDNKRKKTKLFKINFSAAGMVSLLILFGALLLLFAALFIAFRTYGHGDATIGALGFLAFFLNILGIMMPVRDHKMHGAEGGFPMLSRVAVILNALCMAGIVAVYVMGIIL